MCADGRADAPQYACAPNFTGARGAIAPCTPQDPNPLTNRAGRIRLQWRPAAQKNNLVRCFLKAPDAASRNQTASISQGW
jgi:hypothetical protein